MKLGRGVQTHEPRYFNGLADSFYRTFLSTPLTGHLTAIEQLKGSNSIHTHLKLRRLAGFHVQRALQKFKLLVHGKRPLLDKLGV